MEDSGCSRLRGLIEAVQVSARDVSLPAVILFLHVCDHDGISIKDLVYLSGYGESLVSRAIDRLAAGTRRSGSGGALVAVKRHPADGRRRLVFLTEAGRTLKARIGQAPAGLPGEG